MEEGKENDMQNGGCGAKEEKGPKTEAADAAAASDSTFEDRMAIDEVKVGGGDVKSNDNLLTEVHVGRKGNGTSARVANKLRALEKQVGDSKSWLTDSEGEDSEDGTPLQQAAFIRELESFYRERSVAFKAPKFYGEPLNCLKLWRAVIKAGAYDVGYRNDENTQLHTGQSSIISLPTGTKQDWGKRDVTTSKLWRVVGESFHPPKTCTTVSWTFRIFYVKALLEYEKHKRQSGDIQRALGSLSQCTTAVKEASSHQASGSGRARRDAAARAMRGWHAQRLVGYGEIAEPIVKDKNLSTTPKRGKNLKSIGSFKHRTPTFLDHAEKSAIFEADKQLRLLFATPISLSQVVTNIVDLGPPADWVKISVRETKDCFELYALVPGLLREEVRVQSDAAGRLVITGQPEHLDNRWGITPFKKVVSLPGRIDPIQTSAVVSLHGRLFVRVPFEQGAY